MASIKLKGDTSGEIIIQAPAVAGTNTLTLDATTGTILNSNSSIPASSLTGALPAIDGSALTGISTNPYTAQSLSGSGYITLVGGLKINWVTTGTTTATSGTTGFTWASAFTTIYGAVVSQSLGTDSGEIGVNKSTTGGTVDFYAWSGGSKQWTIIGIGV
jgi:hypothetical protein